MNDEPILGIDLGTTNSACAIWTDEGAVQIPNSHGDFLTPSAVGIDDDKTVLIGKPAKQRLVTHPQKTVAYFKRLMGSKFAVKLGRKQQYSAAELSSLVLGSLKRDAESFLGRPVKQAVISVPAYFNEHQRQATVDAGQLAGLEVNRLINEPTAAAIAHGLQEQQERTIMVLDLGGGTFDVSILEYFDDILEVHASAGDSSLGGEDFTQALLTAFLNANELGESDIEPTELQRLYARMETIKRKYKAGQTQEVSLHLGGQQRTWSLTEETFKEATAKLLLRLRAPMERALRDADMVRSNIDEVVLVGGATRMQMFQSLVARTFGIFPRTDVDPDLTIARGTAVMAGLLAKNQALNEVVLTDVCPFSLGIATQGDRPQQTGLSFAPILERNTVVPASRVEAFHTVSDNQKEILVQVYQGESPWVKDNLFLGEFSVKVPPAPEGQETIDVRFSYDVNGLLDIDVTVLSTGKQYNQLIENRAGGLSEAEKKKSRARL
ncbi:MAG: molecular chaperone HscC, partial [Gammaproteobacteria bacterium]|nr:molecular chaperone HscC [Gammaproteobacteria bacterium]